MMIYSLRENPDGTVDVVLEADINYTCLTASTPTELAAFFGALSEELQPAEQPEISEGFRWHGQPGDVAKATAAAQRLASYVAQRAPVSRRRS